MKKNVKGMKNELKNKGKILCVHEKKNTEKMFKKKWNRNKK